MTKYDNDKARGNVCTKNTYGMVHILHIQIKALQLSHIHTHKTHTNTLNGIHSVPKLVNE